METPNALRGRGMQRRYSLSSRLGGSVVAPPAGSGAQPDRKTIFVHYLSEKPLWCIINCCKKASISLPIHAVYLSYT